MTETYPGIENSNASRDKWNARRHGARRRSELESFLVWLDDPDTLLNELVVPDGVYNWQHYLNAEDAALQEKFRFSSDVDGRKKAYATIQQHLAESMVICPLAVLGKTVAITKGVTNVI